MVGPWRWRPILANVTVLVIAAACGGTSSTGGPPPGAAAATGEAQTPSTSASTLSTGPVPLRAGALDAGTYTTTSFDPPLTFTLGDGWQAMFQDDEDEVALDHAGAFLSMTRPSQVIDPTPVGAVPAPDDLATWLSQRPSLVATKPTAVEIVGREGLTFDVGLEHGKEQVDIFWFPTGSLHLVAGTRTRVWVLPMDGPDLVILSMTEEASFQEAVDRAEQVLNSLVIAP